MSNVRLLRAHGALALGVVVLGSSMTAGCTDPTVDTRGSDPTAEPPVIRDGEYVVTEVTERGEPRPLVEGSRMRVRLRDRTFAVRAGCNHLFGEYRLEGDQLTIGPMGGTEMGCPQPLMEQDEWLVEVFSQPVTVEEDPLTLTAGDVSFTLQRRGANPPPATDPDGSTSSTDGPEGVTVP